MKSIAIFGLFSGTLALCSLLEVRLNLSASVPVGIYRADRAGQMAEFCPEEPWGSFAGDRGYREPWLASRCADGYLPLLKPVVAREGDIVRVSAAGIAVNGKPLEKSTPAEKDSRGRLLPLARRGTHVVGPGKIWVISTYHPGSFDSRYFGSISLSSVRAMSSPVWIAR
jgi:conjugative transfer signal peptidase TraF